MTNIVHHHDHVSILLEGDLDWHRSVDPGGLSRGGGFGPAGIRTPPGETA